MILKKLIAILVRGVARVFSVFSSKNNVERKRQDTAHDALKIITDSQNNIQKIENIEANSCYKFNLFKLALKIKKDEASKTYEHLRKSNIQTVGKVALKKENRL